MSLYTQVDSKSEYCFFSSGFIRYIVLEEAVIGIIMLSSFARFHRGFSHLGEKIDHSNQFIQPIL